MLAHTFKFVELELLLSDQIRESLSNVYRLTLTPLQPGGRRPEPALVKGVTDGV